MAAVLEFYKNGVIVRHSGIVIDEDVIEVERSIYGHRYPEPLQFQIVDLSGVKEFRVSVETMREVGRIDREKAKSLNRQCVAVVTPSQGRAMTIIWQAWASDGFESPSLLTKNANTIEEAEHWLSDQGIAAALEDSPDLTRRL